MDMSYVPDHGIYSMLILFLGAMVMTIGFSLRKHAVGPWIVLFGILILLAVVAYDILRQTGSFPL